MMRSIVWCVMGMVVASGAVASEVDVEASQWKPVPGTRIEQSASEPHGVAHLFQLTGLFDTGWLLNQTTAAVAAGVEIDVTTQLTLRRERFSWTGETICEPGDPRLTTTAHTGSACYQSGMCVAWSVAFLDQDPCAVIEASQPRRIVTTSSS